MQRIIFVTTFIGILMMAFAQSAQGQFQEIGPATDYVSWQGTAEPAVVRPGENLYAVFDAEIAGVWKMYALDSSLPSTSEALSRPFGVKIDWVDLPEGITATGNVVQWMPEEGFDENFGLTLKYFHKRARFAAELRVSPDMADGQGQVEAGVQFQICNDDLGVCLNRKIVPVTVAYSVDAACASDECAPSAGFMQEIAGYAAGTPEEAGGEKGSMMLSASADFSTSSAGGFWSFLLLAVGAGLASLLTPCVFPMIPLTVSYFTKHADNRPQALRMASAFGGTIVVTFTGVGVIAALVVGAAGAQQIASNPFVNLFIALVLVVFALSLLGMYELRLPSGLLNYFNRQGNEQSGFLGVLFMGVTLTLVSFSCTAPFIGGLLAAAAGGTWVVPLVGMAVYSATFALPFILLALFPNALSALPRSGSWMNVIKVVLGFVELAASVKFFSNADLIWRWGIISRPLGIAFVVVIFLLAGFYLLGRIRLAHEETLERVGVGRMLGSVVFFVGALYMLPGLLGAPLNRLDAYLPPRQGTDVSIMSLLQVTGTPVPGSTDEGWFVDDIDAALDEGDRINRPLLIDFTGYTCTNCREMEANVFPRQSIQRRFDAGFVLLRLYTDGLESGEEFSRYQLQLTGTVALPTYAIVHPGSGRVIAKRSGMMDEQQFSAFLDTGTATYARVVSD